MNELLKESWIGSRLVRVNVRFSERFSRSWQQGRLLGLMHEQLNLFRKQPTQVLGCLGVTAFLTNGLLLFLLGRELSIWGIGVRILILGLATGAYLVQPNDEDTWKRSWVGQWFCRSFGLQSGKENPRETES